MQQPHDADRIVGREIPEDAVAVREPLSEDLEDGEGQVDDGSVVPLGRDLELGRRETGWEDVLA